MRGDLEIITKEFPYNVLHVYALGDLHVGSPEYDEESVRKKIRIIQEDPLGCVCIAGDLGDFGLKNSVSNVYKQTLSPAAQVDYLYDLFLPIKDKITACVPGNHEDRLTKETGIDPMLTLCCRLGCEDVYRENVAITKYIFGSIDGRARPNTFIGLVTHGTTRNKNKKFLGGFDGLDFAISAHVHDPEYSPEGLIRIDRKSGNIRHVPFKRIVVDANLKPGGYGLKKQYEVAPPPELQYLELRMVREANYNRTVHRIINYHTITL